MVLTGTEGGTLFWVLSVLVCEGERDGVSIGDALTGRWFNAGDGCILALGCDGCVTSDTRETNDEVHCGGTPIWCLCGMTRRGFRSGGSGLRVPI